MNSSFGFVETRSFLSRRLIGRWYTVNKDRGYQDTGGGQTRQSFRIHHGDWFVRAYFRFGTSSGHMFWDIIWMFIVGCVRDLCCWTCLGLMLWNVFGTHLVERVPGPCCRTCSGPTMWGVIRAHVARPIRCRCCRTCSRPME